MNDPAVRHFDFSDPATRDTALAEHLPEAGSSVDEKRMRSAALEMLLLLIIAIPVAALVWTAKFVWTLWK